MGVRNHHFRKMTRVSDLIDQRYIDIEDAPDTNVDYNSNVPGQRYHQLALLATTDLASPASGNEGGIVYDTDTNTVKYCDGSSWAAIDTSGASSDLNTAYDNGAILVVDAAGGDLELDLNDASTDKNVQIKNITTGTIDVGLLVDTEVDDAGCILTDAIKVTTSGAASSIGTGLDVSDAGIATGIDIGGTKIDGTNFNVSAAGAVVGVGVDYGSGALVGTGDVTIGSSSELVVTAASGNIACKGTLTLSAASSDIDVNSGMFTVDATQGNTVIDGSLTVNGAWALGSQLTAGNGIDMDGSELIMDADGNSSLHMDTDDQLDVNLGGSDEYVFTTTSLDLQANELIFDANADTSITADTDDRFDFRIGGTDELQYSTAAFAFQVATTISTGATTLTLDPTTDVVIPNGKGLIIGNAAQVTITPAIAPELEVLGTSGADSTIAAGRWSTDALGPVMVFVSSRHGTIGSTTIVQNNDDLGTILWNADDGGDFVTPAAQIMAEVDGTPGADDMPGRLVFSTTADAGNTVSEAMRINCSQNLCIADANGLIVGDDGTTAGIPEALGTHTPEVQIIGATQPDSSLALISYVAGAVTGEPPEVAFGKSRGATGVDTILVNGDELGQIAWYCNDGTNFDHASAQIHALVDESAIAADKVGGSLHFSTCADGGTTMTEALNFDSSQLGTFAGGLGLKATAPDANTGLKAVYVETDPGATAKYVALLDLQISETSAPAATASMGLSSTITIKNTNAQALTGALSAVEAKFVAENLAGGAITELNAVKVGGGAVDSVTVAAARGLYVLDSTVAGGGAMTAQYGLHIADLTSGVADYGIYLAGADTAAIYVNCTDPSVFKGGVYGSLATTEDLILKPNAADDVTGCIQLGGDGVLGVCIGGDHDDAWNTKNNYLWLADSTASPATFASGNSGAGIFASAGELWSIDDLGNTTQQTSHDKEGNWVFNSVYGGTKTRINIERFLERMIAKYPGEFDDIIEKD